jgi:type IV secretory pathway TrbD component
LKLYVEEVLTGAWREAAVVAGLVVAILVVGLLGTYPDRG